MGPDALRASLTRRVSFNTRRDITDLSQPIYQCC